MAKIGIIVPVYNAEKYVKRLYEDVKVQTYDDYELIFADDGSEDDTLNLCREIERNDARVHTLAFTHRGVSATRNGALDACSAPLVTFLDVDDRLPATMLADLLKAECADLTIAGYEYVQGGKVIVHCPDNETLSLNKPDGRMGLYSFMNSVFSNCVWGKVYRMDIIRANGIRFFENMRLAEDTCFLWQYIMHCDKIQMINEVVYQYFAPRIERKYSMPVDDVSVHLDTIWQVIDGMETRFGISLQNRRHGFLCLFGRTLLRYLASVTSHADFCHEIRCFRSRYGCPSIYHPRVFFRYMESWLIFRCPYWGFFIRGVFA